MDNQMKGFQFKTIWDTTLKDKVHTDQTEYIIAQFKEAQESINYSDDKKFKISYFSLFGKCFRNMWVVKFRSDNEMFKGKQIEGILYFPPEYPKEAPTFYFGHLHNGQCLKHINIYLTGELCVVILNSKNWKQTTNPIDILTAISNTFDQPNEGSPANVAFNQCPKLIQENQQQLQSEQLENYEQEQE